MSKIDYQALRAKAEKATCGELSLEYGKGRFDGDDALIHREVAGYIPICRIEGAHPESGFDEDFQTEQQANAELPRGISQWPRLRSSACGNPSMVKKAGTLIPGCG